jgi:hypothetical protein
MLIQAKTYDYSRKSYGHEHRVMEHKSVNGQLRMLAWKVILIKGWQLKKENQVTLIKSIRGRKKS